MEQGKGLSMEKSVAARRRRRENAICIGQLKKAQDARKTENKELSVQNKAAEVSGTRSQQDLAGCCICPLYSGKVLRGFKGRGEGTMENTGPHLHFNTINPGAKWPAGDRFDHDFLRQK